MKTKMIIILCLGLFTADLFAQHVTDDTVFYTPIPNPITKTRKSKSSMIDPTQLQKPNWYFLSIQSGYLFGCKGCDGGKAMSSSFGVINGLKVGQKGRVGLGVAYDSYWRFQTVPVFASLSWDLIGNRNKNALFLQLNYGQSFAWGQQAYPEYGYMQTSGGRMISPHVGYRLKYHDVSISLLAGVKLQRVFNDYKYPTWTWLDGAYRQGYYSNSVKQDISRLSMTLALGWK